MGVVVLGDFRVFLGFNSGFYVVFGVYGLGFGVLFCWFGVFVFVVCGFGVV